MAPTTQLELSLLTAECSVDPVAGATIEGAFQATATGFTVSKGAPTTEIGGAQPAIPDGTLVRLTWQCGGGVYGGPGAWVMVENLPELDGAPNPTEDGGRLWFFEAAGGAIQVGDVPFDTVAAPHCTEGGGVAYRKPHSITVSGADFDAVALPGETETFAVASGPHAGSYALENVNWTVAANADVWTETNYRITRAP